MQLDNTQSGDINARDIAKHITHISAQTDASIVLLQEVMARIRKLETGGIVQAHIVRLNAIVTAGLLASAIIRYRTGVRRA